MTNLYVICRSCGDRHSSGQVEATNIEENDQGQDVVTFICPISQAEEHSLVFFGEDWGSAA